VGELGNGRLKGSRKGTPYAAQLAARDAARKAMEHGLRQVEVCVKGPAAVVKRRYAPAKFRLAHNQFRDITPIPITVAAQRRRDVCRG